MQVGLLTNHQMTSLQLAQQDRKARASLAEDRLLAAQIDAFCESIELDGPGSAKRVSPTAKKKLKGIIDKYKHSKTPWRDCVKDNTKRFGPEKVKAVCGVIKALGKQPTSKAGLSESCPVVEMDDESFSLLYAISQSADYKAFVGLED